MKWIIDWQIVHGRVQQSLLVLLGFLSLVLGSAQAAHADGILELEHASTLQIALAPLEQSVDRSLDRPIAPPTPKPSPRSVSGSSPSNPSSNSFSNNSGVLDFRVAASPSPAIAPQPNPSSIEPKPPEVPANPEQSPSEPVKTSADTVLDPPIYAAGDRQAVFVGGSDSLVARAVGTAEGTRRPDGGKNPAYYGHVDPGNQRWNLGSFSYQHGATSPAEADEKQLARLQQQDWMLREKAAAYGVRLSLEERLNGIDLANQAPLAALDRGGYIERLKQAQAEGLRGEDAILDARVNAYRHPDTNLWDAPGLGNNEASIRHDQARRINAIAQAIAFDEAWVKRKNSHRVKPIASRELSKNQVAQAVTKDQAWVN